MIYAGGTTSKAKNERVIHLFIYVLLHGNWKNEVVETFVYIQRVVVPTLNGAERYDDGLLLSSLQRAGETPTKRAEKEVYFLASNFNDCPHTTHPSNSPIHNTTLQIHTLPRPPHPNIYKTSPTILAASRYVANNFSHFSLSFLMPSSSYSKSPKYSSLYSSLTKRFCTTSLEWLTRRCMTALGTWSAMDSRTMLK